jgi:hypothetical protein
VAVGAGQVDDAAVGRAVELGGGGRASLRPGVLLPAGAEHDAAAGAPGRPLDPVQHGGQRRRSARSSRQGSPVGRGWTCASTKAGATRRPEVRPSVGAHASRGQLPATQATRRRRPAARVANGSADAAPAAPVQGRRHVGQARRGHCVTGALRRHRCRRDGGSRTGAGGQAGRPALRCHDGPPREPASRPPVHEVLGRSMLVDGFDMVLDLRVRRVDARRRARRHPATSTCSPSSPPRRWA